MSRGFTAWLRAYGLYTGGVIGVGIFGLPAALARSGLAAFVVHLVVVGFLAWWIQRSFIAVVCRTRGRHRLPGYARIHLGRALSGVASFANILGLVGALVAYLIAGGTFVRLLVEPLFPLAPPAAMLLYLVPGAFLLLVGLRALPAVELVILGLFLFVLALLPPAAVGNLRFADLSLLGDAGAWFLPYGVLLFSFWGVSLIPETVELARRNERRAARVVSVGLATAALSYLLFAVLIAAITGQGTTEDALEGLQQILGDGVVLLTLVFGILTTFSSYLALGITLLRTLAVDFRLSRHIAWAVTIVVPLLLVGYGAQSLLLVLSLTGAVFLGTEGLLVLAMRWKLARGRTTRALTTGLALGAVLLVLGIVAELLRPLVS